MKVYLYHTKPLSNHLRKDFELPAYPHSNDPDAIEVFDSYMRELGICQYQDDLIGFGKTGKATYPAKIYEWEGVLEPPVKAYRSSVLLDNDEFMVKKWQQNQMSNTMYLKMQEDLVGRDMMAWDSWNVKGWINRWTKSLIEFESDEDYNIRISEEVECHKDVNAMTPEEKRIIMKK